MQTLKAFWVHSQPAIPLFNSTRNVSFFCLPFFPARSTGIRVRGGTLIVASFYSWMKTETKPVWQAKNQGKYPASRPWWLVHTAELICLLIYQEFLLIYTVKWAANPPRPWPNIIRPPKLPVSAFSPHSSEHILPVRQTHLPNRYCLQKGQVWPALNTYELLQTILEAFISLHKRCRNLKHFLK